MEKKEPDFARIDSILNPSDGKLPFGYYAPESDGKVTWNCGTDQEGKIISIFCCDEGGVKDKKIAILPNMSDAIYARDVLIKSGWQKIKPPEITVSHEDGTKKPLSRQQKRALKKHLNKMNKENPFDDNYT